jgi:hypothetical protein
VVRDPPTDTFTVPRNTTPTVYLEFPEPVDAELILGIPKKVTAIGISPDTPELFADA